MTRRCLYVLAVAFLLVQFLSGAEPASLADVLGSKDRWAQVMGLRDWRAPLAPAEVESLKGFVAGQRGKDWVLYSLGQRLLRRAGEGQGQVPPEVEKAEEILLGVAWESDVSVFYQRDDAAELVKLGPAIIPLLKEIVDFQELPDYARRRAAIEALTRLGDASLVPFLKEHLGKPKWPDSGMGVLDAILRLEPTFENADFVASNGQGHMTIGPAPTTKLPPAISLYLLKRTLERSRGVQEPETTLVYLEELDTPEAFKAVSDILLQQQPKTWDQAVRALHRMHAGDPLPVFLAALETTPLEENRAFTYFIHPLVERGYRDAIPVFQRRRAAIAQRRSEIDGKLADLAREAGKIPVSSPPPEEVQPPKVQGNPPRPFAKVLFDMEVEVEKDLELQRRDLELAAALAGFGVDYDLNALRVRQALSDWDTCKTAFRVVGLLHDDVTVDELCRLLVARDPWPQVYHPAAQAARNPKEGDPPGPLEQLHREAILRLGKIGSVRAHDALVKAAPGYRLFYLEDIGRALRTIGKANNRPDIQLEGEDFIAIAQYVWYMSRPRTEPFPLPAPESASEQELARRAQAAALRQPAVGRFVQSSSLWSLSVMQRLPPHSGP